MSVGLAIAVALFVWWFSTGAILLLVRLSRGWHLAAMVVASGVAILAVWGLAATRTTVTPAGALAGFTYGILIWAWLEMSFLFGFVTGPRKEPMSPGATGWRRFREAFATLAWHELAILATGIALVVLAAGAPNAVGTWTFLVLWAMRISAKLNLFAGAPNVSTEFLPRELSYLATYFARGRAGLFFHLSVGTATFLCGMAIHAAFTATDPYLTVATTLLATLLALAVLEHWFLVLPFPDATLWRWALRADAAPVQAPAAVTEPSFVPLAVPAARRAVPETGPAQDAPVPSRVVVLPRRAS